MAKLAVDVFRPDDGLGDFCPQEFAEAPPEPMHRYFYVSFREIQLIANLRARDRGFIAPNENLQFFEEPGFVCRGVFPPQSGEYLLDQDHSPALIVGAFRIGFVDRFGGVPLLSFISIQKYEGPITPALETAG